MSITLQSTVGGFSAAFMKRLPQLEAAMVAHGLEPSAFILSKDNAVSANARPLGPFFYDYTVFVDGAAITTFTVGAHATVSFATPPAVGKPLTWTGRYLFNCRFDQDELDCQQMMEQLWSQSGIDFITVPL